MGFSGDDPVQSVAVYPQHDHTESGCPADQRYAHAERKHVTIGHEVTAPRFQVVFDAEYLEVGGERDADVEQLMAVPDDVEAAGTEALGDV